MLLSYFSHANVLHNTPVDTSGHSHPVNVLAVILVSIVAMILVWSVVRFLGRPSAEESRAKKK